MTSAATAIASPTSAAATTPDDSSNARPTAASAASASAPTAASAASASAPTAAAEATAPPTFAPPVTKPLVAATPAAPPIATALPSVEPTGTDAPDPAAEEGWVDLLAWTEGVDWSPRGVAWNAKLAAPASRAGLTLRPGEQARFPLAAIVAGEYDLEATLAAGGRDPSFTILFPVERHVVQLELGNVNSSLDSLRYIDEQTDARKSAARREPSRVADGRAHRVAIRVRKLGDEWRIEVDLDDEPNYLAWQGDPARLVNVDPGQWKPTMIEHVWLATGVEEPATFAKVRVKMLSGTIERDVITEADRAKDLENGFVRLVGERPTEVKVGWNSFVVNQMPPDAGPGATERGWPLVTPEVRRCTDAYWAHAPCRIDGPVPRNAASFSVVGFNPASRQVRYFVEFDGRRAYESPVTGIRVVKVPVPPRAKTMTLIVDEAGKTDSDHTWWCYPRFHSVPVDALEEERLTEPESPALKFRIASHQDSPWGPLKHVTERDPAVNSSLIDFRAARPCHEFLYAHAPSGLTFDVPPGMTRFTAVGYNAMSSGGVKFALWTTEKFYESDVAGVAPIDVKLPPGTRRLTLKVYDLGNRSVDQSMWCYPRLHR